MVSINHATRFVSFVAGLLVCGIASLQTARAQDAEPPAGYPSATPSADPNAPPPGAYPVAPLGGTPPAVQQSVAASYKSYVLMPFVGIQSIQNENSGTGPGLRLGGLVGGRMSELFSFNGELLFDLANFNNVPAGLSESAYFLQFAAAPLLHLAASPTAEIVLGPKVGLFVEHFSASGSLGGAYTLDASGNAEGLAVGANLGAFFRVSDDVSLGGLINFDYLREEWCSNSQGTCTVSGDGLKVISFTGAAQF
jgi:hypothetical protein